MRKFAFAGLATAAFAGAAIAAVPPRHLMDVALPDGSTAHVEYYGDVAPKVTVSPAQTILSPAFFGADFFPDFGRIIQQMNREHLAMLQQLEQIPSQPLGPNGTFNVASFGNMPEGTSSVSVTSVTENGVTCTRTTRTVMQGMGKPPKVSSSLSGTCANAQTGGEPQAKPTA